MSGSRRSDAAQKRVLIVGGGVAGLAAGCYAQMNGFDAHIFEQHTIAGGLCTAWRRHGYTFDTSIHMLMGARRGGMQQMWRELGVVQGRTLVDHASAGTYMINGTAYTVPARLDAYEAQMCAWSPADAPLVRGLCSDVRALLHTDIWSDKPQALWNPLDAARFAWAARGFLRMHYKHRGVSVEQFAARFQHPDLRALMLLNADAPSWQMPDMPLDFLLVLMAERENCDMGYPIGGSFNVAQTMARRFTELGGHLHLRTRVARVLVEDNRAAGLVLADDETVRGDYVISASDGRTMIWEMLGGRYVGEDLDRKYHTWRVVAPVVQVMIGVNRDLAAEPSMLSLELPRPMTIAGAPRTRMDVMHYGFDPTMAPAGKSVMQVWFCTDWAYWEACARDPARYAAAKAATAAAVLDALEAHWPGFTRAVEVVDVPTPVTYRRYTGNEQGSPDGWCATTQNSTSSMGYTLPGLAHFFMVGQWTMPFAGVPGSCLSARQVLQLVCRQERQRFATNLPPAGWGPVATHAPESALAAAQTDAVFIAA